MGRYIGTYLHNSVVCRGLGAILPTVLDKCPFVNKAKAVVKLATEEGYHLNALLPLLKPTFQDVECSCKAIKILGGSKEENENANELFDDTFADPTPPSNLSKSFKCAFPTE